MEALATTRRLSRTSIVIVVALAIAAAASIAVTPAGAAGFGAPRMLTPKGGTADEPLAVVAGNGRSAVFARWITGRGTGLQVHEQAWLGPDADHLAGPVDVPGATHGEDLQAAAEPDGTIVACSTPVWGNPITLTCTLAPPGGGFGPPQVVASVTTTSAARRVGRTAGFDVIALADGRLALITGQSPDGVQTQTTIALAPAGTLAFSAAAPIATRAGQGGDAFAPLPDGGLMEAYTTADPVRGTEGGGVTQVLAPGASAFAAPTPFTAPKATSGLAGIDVGRYGVAISTRKQRKNAPEQTLVSVQRADGWSSPTPLRAVTDGFVGGDVLFLPDHSPLVISYVSHESATDCGQQTLGRIGAGPLTGARPTLLSNKHQIANPAGARVLDDGTVVALWTDSADAARVEYAIRSPQAHHFGPAHPLPITAAREVRIASDGHQLLATWITGSLPDGPSRLVVTTLRTTPPYARDATRPAHPSAPCG
ncbi:MAG TPA: hypothetical protein VI318_26425 [Baekduia sp.]